MLGLHRSTRKISLGATSALTHAFNNLSIRQMSSIQPEQREVVTFLGLNNLSDNEGAVKTRRRVGRGIGSSKGKTCGRGHKGQKARSGGGVKPFFEGGQTSFIKRVPKRGFKNRHAEPMVPINVGTLQDYIDMGRLIPSDDPLTIKDLVDAGVTKCSSVKHGVKLLAKGKERLKTPIKIEISRASEGAIEAIENVGGEITTVHYNRLALRALLKPEKFEIIPKRARPPPKLMQYYTDYEKRGFLSPEIQLRKLKEELDATSEKTFES
jgi:ribosomal protein L15, bacterial/organelle